MIMFAECKFVIKFGFIIIRNFIINMLFLCDQ